jgi:hypothetical protein
MTKVGLYAISTSTTLESNKSQRPMIPRRRTDEVLDDLALDIDQGRDRLSILAGHVRQQPLEVEMHGVLVGFGLQCLLIGHNELAETIYHLLENVRGTRQSLNSSSRRCAHAGVIFSPPHLALSIGHTGWKRLIQQEVTGCNEGQKMRDSKFNMDEVNVGLQRPTQSEVRRRPR